MAVDVVDGEGEFGLAKVVEGGAFGEDEAKELVVALNLRFLVGFSWVAGVDAGAGVTGGGGLKAGGLENSVPWLFASGSGALRSVRTTGKRR